MILRLLPLFATVLVTFCNGQTTIIQSEVLANEGGKFLTPPYINIATGLSWPFPTRAFLAEIYFRVTALFVIFIVIITSIIPAVGVIEKALDSLRRARIDPQSQRYHKLRRDLDEVTFGHFAICHFPSCLLDFDEDGILSGDRIKRMKSMNWKFK